MVELWTRLLVKKNNVSQSVILEASFALLVKKISILARTIFSEAITLSANTSEVGLLKFESMIRCLVGNVSFVVMSKTWKTAGTSAPS